MDDPSNPPVVITEQRLKDKNILECPDDLQVSMAMPAMVIECWFDMAHPTGGEKNYDPIMKQLLIMSTLHEIRLEVNQMRKPLKISLEKPCEYERMPWVWICAAKVKKTWHSNLHCCFFTARSRESQSKTRWMRCGSSEHTALPQLMKKEVTVWIIANMTRIRTQTILTKLISRIFSFYPTGIFDIKNLLFLTKLTAKQH